MPGVEAGQSWLRARILVVAVAIALTSAAALPGVRTAVVTNVVNVAALRRLAILRTDWLRPDPVLSMVWAEPRHSRLLAVGRPGTPSVSVVEARLAQLLSHDLPAHKSSPGLTNLLLLNGEWTQAARILEAAEKEGAPPPQASDTAYGYQAIQGLAALRATNYRIAVGHLQLAAWLGGDRASPDGTLNWLYTALAGQYEPDGEQWTSAYLRAKYLDLADDERAGEALRGVVARSPGGAAAAFVADAERRLARRMLAHGDTSGARQLLENVAANPATPTAVLVDTQMMLTEVGDAAFVSRLALVLGSRVPTYPVGQWRAGGWQNEAQPVGPDWLLVGYDLDEQALEVGAEIETVLYWQPARGQQPLLLQRVMLRNLAPNGGFEWASPTDAATVIPLGYVGSGGGVPGPQEVVQIHERAGPTHTLTLDRTTGRQAALLSSAAVPVAADAILLEGAWRFDPDGAGLFGRSCGTDEGVGGPQYVAYQEQVPNWRHYAGVGPALDGQPASLCYAFLTNATAGSVVRFDDLLLAAISPPASLPVPK